jgi:hypothetical protein
MTKEPSETISRRRLLRRLGLTAVAAYAAPVMLHMNPARASGASGGSGASGASGGSGPSGRGRGSAASGPSGRSRGSRASAPSGRRGGGRRSRPSRSGGERGSGGRQGNLPGWLADIARRL